MGRHESVQPQYTTPYMKHQANRGMLKQAKFFGGSGQALQKKLAARKKQRVGIGQIGTFIFFQQLT